MRIYYLSSWSGQRSCIATYQGVYYCRYQSLKNKMAGYKENDFIFPSREFTLWNGKKPIEVFWKVSNPSSFEILMRKVYTIVFSRFRAMFVHFIPCVSLVILNFLLFRAMKEAENKREKLLNSNPKVNFNRRETKESKKIRDANTTTLMLIVVISVSRIPLFINKRFMLDEMT